jgi:hypothetical protein
MPMPTGVPSETAPATVGRQGARSRADSDAADGGLSGSPLSSRPGGDGAG